MSYTPTEWKSGDTVTSAKLNKIENGFSTVAPFIIEAIDEDGSFSLTASTTYNDVMAALNQERIVIVHVLRNQLYHYVYYFFQGGHYDDEYWLTFYNIGIEHVRLHSDSADTPLTLDSDEPTVVA